MFFSCVKELPEILHFRKKQKSGLVTCEQKGTLPYFVEAF